MTTHWSPSAPAKSACHDRQVAPKIEKTEIQPIIPDLDLWDHWPVQHRDGRIAEIAGGSLIILLSAPRTGHPDERHAVARLRLLHRKANDWRDLGPLLPEEFSPGSREWAGSAVLSDAGDRVTLYFTAAGFRGEAQLSFAQRLFETSATLTIIEDVPSLTCWTPPLESVVADGEIYMRDMAGGGGLGTIKAFRDPAYFLDPADGAEYLLFTGSLAASVSECNGAIGLAKRVDSEWKLTSPLIEADGVNNELERPHVIVHGNHYYCFWSTQTKVFASGVEAGPNGLYGMVADQLAGPWRPLNGSGVVLANPNEAPLQQYSWLVLPDLSVTSFVDVIDLDEMPKDIGRARQYFGGTPAAAVQLQLVGDQSTTA